MLSLNKIEVYSVDKLLAEDPLAIAKNLLNQYLISQIDELPVISRIVETEAYKAPEDKASHAYGNKRTDRTRIMFEKGGIAYVYLCYGMHDMLNVVSGPENMAHAILIRAVEVIEGEDTVLQRRSLSNLRNASNGPGKLCRALGISRAHNGIQLCDKNSAVWLGCSDELSDSKIISGPRVGVAYAEECAHWPWRFRIKGNPWSSKPDQVIYNKSH